MSAPRALAPALLLALAACPDGQASESTGGAQTGDPASTGADASTSSSSSAATDTGSTGATTGTTTPPPPECDALDVCGVLCVDLASDPANCGDCGVTCVIPHASPGCSAGQCALGQCDDGWFDCDQDLLNGCESQLAPGQMCGLVCKEGKPEQCNLFDDDCNGQCDEGALPGCRQPVHRASSPTLGHLYTIDAAEAMSGDLKPEFLNYYYLYAAAGPGLVPFYRCLKGDGRRFYTTSGTCENAGPVEGELGQIATDPQCGAVPLFRLYGNSDHFYTTSEAERDNAVAMYGYKYESIAGYVWPGP